MPFLAYAITNLIDGKRYIGITTSSLRQRWMEHVRQSGETRLLQRAIRKHGQAAFRIEHIASAIDRSGLMALESLLIKQEGTLAPAGYNLTTGGEHPQISPELRVRLSEKAIVRFTNPQARSVLAASARKWLEQPGAKERVGDAVRASKANPEAKLRHAKIARERWTDPDYRTRVAKAIRLQWKDADGRRKKHAEVMRNRMAETSPAELAAASAARWADPELRARMEKNLREALSKPEERARRAESARAQWADPETRARMVQARRARKSLSNLSL